MGLLTTENIPYFEYRAINELRQAHRAEFDGDLIAFIVFGDLIASGDSYDIHVLEIMRNWSGSRSLTFVSSESLFLRGTLFLNFMTPEEFETMGSAVNAEQIATAVVPLLEQVRKAYVVMYEEVEGYVVRALEGSPTSESNDSRKINPLSLRDLATVR